jgi:hypothetical protein
MLEDFVIIKQKIGQSKYRVSMDCCRYLADFYELLSKSTKDELLLQAIVKLILQS